MIFSGRGGRTRTAGLTVPNRALYQLSHTPQSTFWYPQQELNLHLALRRRSFYPLNYEGELTNSNTKIPVILLKNKKYPFMKNL